MVLSINNYDLIVILLLDYGIIQKINDFILMLLKARIRAIFQSSRVSFGEKIVQRSWPIFSWLAGFVYAFLLPSGPALSGYFCIPRASRSAQGAFVRAPFPLLSIPPANTRPSASAKSLPIVLGVTREGLACALKQALFTTARCSGFVL